MPQASASPGRADHPATRLATPLLSAIAGLLVFRGALTYYFSQDDFLGLARAAGLAPRLTGVWRYLSHQAFFDLMRPLAGLDAAPYHVVGLVTHAACAALLAVVLTRIVSRPAALLGAVFFAAHPALFTGVYWISAIGDSMALMLALGTLLLALRGDRLRWASLPLFGLSLLAKESTLLLPLVVMLVARAAQPVWRGARGVAIGLGAIGVLYLAFSFTGNAFGVRAGLPGEAPYAVGFGSHVGANALTYLGWTANFILPTVRGFTDAVDPSVYAWGIALFVVWLAGLVSRDLRTQGWLMGGAAFALLLLPVLPLRNHTYHYYLYAPLIGAAWCVAAAADWATARAGRPLLAWTVAFSIAVLLAVNGAMVVRKVETAAFVLPDLRADPTVDRARIARNVYESIRAARPESGAILLFWSPTAASLGAHGEALGAPSPRETYWERNVREALLSGLAVRVMFPQAAEVRFVREFQPAPANTWYAVYRPEGRVRMATPAEVDSILKGMKAAP